MCCHTLSTLTTIVNIKRLSLRDVSRGRDSALSPLLYIGKIRVLKTRSHDNIFTRALYVSLPPSLKRLELHLRRSPRLRLRAVSTSLIHVGGKRQHETN